MDKLNAPGWNAGAAIAYIAPKQPACSPARVRSPTYASLPLWQDVWTHFERQCVEDAADPFVNDLKVITGAERNSGYVA